MSKHLVLVGAGHAHMTVLLRLEEYVRAGHRVTVVSPSPYQYYSGMGPGMLSGLYRPQQVRFCVQKMTEDRGGRFLRDEVTRIDPAAKSVQLQSGETVSYDVASFNTGSHVSMQNLVTTLPPNVYPVKPVINLLALGRRLAERVAGDPPRVVVVGGGPAGVEVAANAWRRSVENGAEPRVVVVSGGGFLRPFPEKARKLARRSFADRGIELLEGRAVARLEEGKVILEDGETIASDVTIVATGTRPASLFRESGLPVGDDGGLLVNEFLESVDDPEIFGGGDCITYRDAGIARVGVHAVRQNPILYANLMAALGDGERKTFRPQANVLLILNMGDGTGILTKYGFTLRGRWVFRLKDLIDRRFMARFQVSGELKEPDDGPETEPGR